MLPISDPAVWQRFSITSSTGWGAASMFPALPMDEIHVWCASLDLPASARQELAATLSMDEHTRAGRLLFECDRRRFIARRGILRMLLACYIGIEPDALVFETGANGKPELVGGTNARCHRFNCSHSRGLALFAISGGRRIGIDVEQVRPVPDAVAIARRFFAPREFVVLRDIQAEQRDEVFLNCWTRKEAYLKATGEGLTRSPADVEVSLAPDGPARLAHIDGDPEAARRWSLMALSPARDYVAALAVEGDGWHLVCRRLYAAR